jgi:hypothetical protein
MDILPDSRCKAATNVVKIDGVNHVPIFCMNCGIEGGLVTERGVFFVGWQCDACQEKYPLPPGTHALPDDEHNRKVAEEWDRAGSVERVMEQLQNERSPLSLLAKEYPKFRSD